jgi:hypothetical protein
VRNAAKEFPDGVDKVLYQNAARIFHLERNRTMIVDMLTHIGIRKGENYQVDSLLELMDEAKIDRCMICSQLETIDNGYIFDCTRGIPTGRWALP